MAKFGKKGLKMERIIFYDKENDILFVHNGFSKNEGFKGNIEVGNVILDVSTSGRVRGVEILGASGFFKEFNIGRKILENISDIEFNSTMKPSGIAVTILIKSRYNKQEIPAKIALPLDLPLYPRHRKF